MIWTLHHFLDTFKEEMTKIGISDKNANDVLAIKEVAELQAFVTKWKQRRTLEN